MSTPDLFLKTAFMQDEQGRITSTREPRAKKGPLFALIKGKTSCAWAAGVSLPDDLIRELDNLARKEPSVADFRDTPVHAKRYQALIASHIRAGHGAAKKVRRFHGVAFTFPDGLEQSSDVVSIDNEQLLERYFSPWMPGEIAAGRSPVVAIIKDDYPISLCFSARRSETAVEAGLETAKAFRGCGYGSLVTAAWALAIRAAGQIPLYSTAWNNYASLSVARKLSLVAYASTWAILAK